MTDFSKSLNQLSDYIKITEIQMRRNSFILETSFESLSWRKFNEKGFRIMYEDKPLIETKLEIRIAQVQFVKGLRNKAESLMIQLLENTPRLEIE